MRSRDKLKLLYLYYHSAYIHQIWQAGGLPWVASTHIVTPLFGQVVVQDQVTNWNHYISTTTISVAEKHCTSTITFFIATKRRSLLTYIEWLLPTKSHTYIITWSCKITWQLKNYISINTISVAINFYKVGIYSEGFPFIKSPDPLITWSCRVIKTILTAVSLLTEGLWPQHLAKRWLSIRNFNPLSDTTLWTRGNMRSSDKLKMLYLHYHNTYGYQTWQGGYL